MAALLKASLQRLILSAHKVIISRIFQLGRSIEHVAITYCYSGKDAISSFDVNGGLVASPLGGWDCAFILFTRGSILSHFL